MNTPAQKNHILLVQPGKTPHNRQSPKAAQGMPMQFMEVEPWPEPVIGHTLLDELTSFVLRFVVCERHTAEAAALWIVFTWLIDAVTVAPIANITAPLPNCGKSTLLDLFEKLCRRPLKADHITAAALFRSIDAWNPTLLIDEVDTFLNANEDARGILNSGHKRNGAVLRVVGESHEPRQFSTWGAKALCGIGKIAKTLQSRSIRLELRRKLPGETVENLRHASPDEIQRLQQQLARFSDEIFDEVTHARPAPVPGLNNRAQDNWEPLLAIADAAGGAWPARARVAAQKICESEALHESPDIATQLLTDVRAVFESRKLQRIYTTELIEHLCEDEEAPWCTWNRGKPISARQLSAKLSDFGIRPQDLRIGTNVRKGYELAKMEDAFNRYLSNASE